MEDFFDNVFNKEGINPPHFCLQVFNESFGGAVNVDWFHRKTFYEAIFYKDNIEHIAVFNESGSLEEYKMFLPNGFLPVQISSYVDSRGEIMNAVLINKGSSIIYEIIFRDASLNRHLLLLTELGKVIEERAL